MNNSQKVKTLIIALIAIFAIALIVIVKSLCNKTSIASVSLDPDLIKMEKANPEIDLKRSIANNDLRFIGIMGLALELPGVETIEKYTLYKKIYGIKVIRGTSDVVINEEHRRLQDIARKYASVYNRMLSKYVEDHPELLKNKSLNP